MKQQVFAAVFAAVTMLGQARPSAQQPATPPAAPAPATAPASTIPPVYQVQIDANTTREQLQDILRQYPPTVGEVLRRDPSLLNRADYLSPYPQLVGFLQAHPEINRNPSFYFGGYEYYERRAPLSPEIEARGVRTTHKANKVSGRKKGLTVKIPHNCSIARDPGGGEGCASTDRKPINYQ